MIGCGYILDCYLRLGDRRYDGEDVTQLQHAWQCGQLALRAAASPALQLAAWLHDLGHLLHGLPGRPSVDGVDDRHEAIAAQALAPLFGPAVAGPVGLHVQAKRYLVATRRDYARRLSADSVLSLALQGGPMHEDEAARFAAEPFFHDAIRLRAWDDAAKDPAWTSQSTQAAVDSLARLMQAVGALRI